MTDLTNDTIHLPKAAAMQSYQKYIHSLETMHGWLDVDLIHNCFLMGEEVGELFSAIRKYEKYYTKKSKQLPPKQAKEEVAEELVDVFNYVLALANRLDIDMEAAFIKKNSRNQRRSWD